MRFFSLKGEIIMKTLSQAALAGAFILGMTGSADAHCVRGYIWIFTQPVCLYCDQARALLLRNGIQFVFTQTIASNEPNWYAKEFSTADRRNRYWTVNGQTFVTTIDAYARWRFGMFGT